MAFDIRGDSKIMFIDWPDMNHEDKNKNKIIIIDERNMLQKMDEFRKRNMDVIEGLKSKLVNEKLIPDLKESLTGKRKGKS